MAELVWDERLISRDQVWRQAGARELRGAIRDGAMYLDCGQCGRAVTMLSAGRWTTPEGIASAVLTHRVMHHAESTNGAAHGRGRASGDGAEVPGAGGAAGAGGGADPRRGLRAEAVGGAGVGAAEGGAR